MKSLKYAILFGLTIGVCSCSTDDVNEHRFENKIFINLEDPIENCVFKSGEEPSTAECELTVSTALKTEKEVTGKFVASPELKDKYNQIYSSEAELLPVEKCIIEKPEIKIPKGEIESSPVTIKFEGLEVLDRNKLYVMPVSLVDINGVDVLSSKTEKYFVFKGASLINVVADISENYFPVNWSDKSLVKSMKTITVEALIRVRDFGNAGGKKGENISTIFGREGEDYFLLRVGDAGFPRNQVQMVSPGDKKFPEYNSELGLQENVWNHVAVVWSAETGEQIMYVNGVEIAKSNNVEKNARIDLSEDCFIGRSFNDERWLEGEISELRVWNIKRTEDEIKNNIYTLNPTTPGLIAYWKFNDGKGKIVKDWSVNGNNITANKDLVWNKVALPE